MKKQLSFGAVLTLLSGSAFADVGSAISAAYAAGKHDAMAAASGVIIIGAVVVAVSVILSLFRK
jgi:xanthine/uracil permease